MHGLQCLILAGGKGRRVASIACLAKQFHILPRGISTFMMAIARAAPLAADLWIIGLESNRGIMESQIESAHCMLLGKKPRIHLVLEPHCKNTLLAVFFGLLEIEEYTKGKSPVLIMPSDHIISPIDSFVRSVKDVVRTSNAGITLFGIQPTGENTGFGHIFVKDSNANYSLVESFLEKPSAEVLASMRAEYLWNSGIFYGDSGYLLRLIRAFYPGFEKKHSENKVRQRGVIETQVFLGSISYRDMGSMPFDKVLEFHGVEMRVKRVDFAWSDIGSLKSFAAACNLKGL